MSASEALKRTLIAEVRVECPFLDVSVSAARGTAALMSPEAERKTQNTRAAIEPRQAAAYNWRIDRQGSIWYGKSFS